MTSSIQLSGTVLRTLIGGVRFQSSGSDRILQEKQDDNKEDIYSNIDEMLSSTLDPDEKK